jgi:peptide deformylase
MNKARLRKHESSVFSKHRDRYLKRIVKVLVRANNSFGYMGEGMRRMSGIAMSAAKAGEELRRVIMVMQKTVKPEDNNHPFSKFIGNPKFR